MNISNLLKTEQQTILSLFSRLERTKNFYLEERTYLFRQLKNKIDSYIKIKENAIYNKLNKYEELKDVILDNIKSDRVIKHNLDNISKESFDRLGWLTEVENIKYQFQNQVKKQETQLFENAYDIMTGKQFKEILVQV